LNFLCKRLHCLPTDVRILEMDEYTKKWHFYCWLEEREEKAKFMKDLGCFVGSFSNPEMAQKIRDMENSKKYEVDDESYDEATKIVEDSMKQREVESKNTGRRGRKISIIR